MRERKNSLWLIGGCLLFEIIICAVQFIRDGALANPVLSVICVGVVAWCFGFECGSWHEVRKMIRDIEKLMEDNDGEE